ncbi:hypothetical protein BACCOPRO_03284 [Phocaeicola coprophilus DSM 18228 = JCM 13818]|uniref:Uncharacterized protein n=1 Tax=Phocaeicola coprophilus DSM 18228 = JCM 13818 TaxID=547042 RepID=S0FEJ5_9BACT|nr:hypothetical protein BACCOPRO_03284 [Phocaeicola coprophilus DSM 18228 = JCM 13818]
MAAKVRNILEYRYRNRENFMHICKFFHPAAYLFVSLHATDNQETRNIE